MAEVTELAEESFVELYREALRAISRAREEGMREGVEMAARVADEELEARRADLKRSPLDNFTRGQINTALRLQSTIRSLAGRG